MPGDELDVRQSGHEAANAFFDAELARRRKRRLGAEEIQPNALPAHLEQRGERRRIWNLRVLSPDWRWPWGRLAHVDLVDCDFENVKLRGLLRPVSFEDCRFESLDLGGARIFATVSDCTFTNVSLVGTGTSVVEGGVFRRPSFSRLDARGALFDKARFEDCAFDGIRGRATIFRECTFVRTRVRGTVSDVSLVDCRFDDVDMADARISRTYIQSRIARGLVYPASPAGFVIEARAYRQVVDSVQSSFDAGDVMALRESFVDGGYEPADELVIDREKLGKLSEAGRERLRAALFERRLVRRG